MAAFGQRWGGSGAPPYWLRIRDRVVREVEARRGSTRGTRRVESWGPWRKLVSAGTRPAAALAKLEELRRLHPTSEVAVTRKGQRVTADQLRARIEAEELDLDLDARAGHAPEVAP